MIISLIVLATLSLAIGWALGEARSDHKHSQEKTNPRCDVCGEKRPSIRIWMGLVEGLKSTWKENGTTYVYLCEDCRKMYWRGALKDDTTKTEN